MYIYMCVPFCISPYSERNIQRLHACPAFFIFLFFLLLFMTAEGAGWRKLFLEVDGIGMAKNLKDPVFCLAGWDVCVYI